MPIFSESEKEMIGQALQIYLQVASQQLPEAQLAAQVQTAQRIMEKFAQGEAGAAAVGGKPKGVSDVHFKQVCRHCDMLAPDGSCLDKITAKFPGKCDPIITYERNKSKPK